MQQSFIELPIYLSGWTIACFWGLAIGPGVFGFAVESERWRLGLWEVVWLSSPILIILFSSTLKLLLIPYCVDEHGGCTSVPGICT